MAKLRVTREDFLNDSQGRTFADVVNDPEQPFDSALEFFSDADRQRRMEESELHHERSPLAGVVRELESHPARAFVVRPMQVFLQAGFFETPPENPGALNLKVILKMELFWIHSLTRSTYSPMRVSIRISSPSWIKGGTFKI